MTLAQSPRRDWRLIGLGLALMVLGSPVTVPLIPVVAIALVPLFPLGWILIGAGLHPSGNAERGALLAAALYILIGLVWVVIYTLINPYHEQPSRGDFIKTRSFLVLVWPWHVAFVLGLFGLGPE